jgi:hypothetical protein
MATKKNYSEDRSTQENLDPYSKYERSGESEFSRDRTLPLDEDEVLIERHYYFEPFGKRKLRGREPRSGPPSLAGGHRGKGPKNYKRTDEKIVDDVSEALYRNTFVDASRIEVHVDKGIVTLKGFVSEREQKKEAERAIDHLPGVEDIFNELHVQKTSDRLKKSPRGLIDNITGLN